MRFGGAFVDASGVDFPTRLIDYFGIVEVVLESVVVGEKQSHAADYG